MIAFFEGLDGSGKSSVSKLVADVLRKYGLTVCHTRAPGGTPAAERIRELLMGHERLHPDTILLLFSAAANEQLQFIKEQEATCDIVVCDRWLFSTFAYQLAMDANPELVMEMIRRVMFTPYDPRLAFYLDATPEVREQRIYDRGGDKDRFSSFPQFRRSRMTTNYATMIKAGWLTPVNANTALAVVVDDCTERILRVRDPERVNGKIAPYTRLKNLPPIEVPKQQ